MQHSKLVLASNNAGKAREIGQMLAGLDIEVLPQSQFIEQEAEENGLSFVENALLKARHAARASGLPAIADDSGIAVDALNGAPGIYSARFAGPEASDEQNWRKLLHDLRDVPEARRGGRFICAMVFLRHAEDPTPIICQGSWEGRILTAPQGENGFGYDPVFFVPEQGVSAAELSAGQKNALSHRGQALRQMVEKLGAL